jgi:hypothetical protein
MTTLTFHGVTAIPLGWPFPRAHSVLPAVRAESGRGHMAMEMRIICFGKAS